MGFKEWNERMYHACLDDIEIAGKEIAEVKLFPEENIICDLYALPSVDFQTCYGMIYERGGHLEMVYARTEFFSCTSPYSEPIRTYSFFSNKEAWKYPGLDGRIITGIRRIPMEMGLLIKDIVEKLPDEKYILKEDTVMIDGVLQAVRVFKSGAIIKEVVYHDAKQIPFKNNGEYLAKELNNLYIKIGELMNC